MKLSNYLFDTYGFELDTILNSKVETNLKA